MSASGARVVVRAARVGVVMALAVAGGVALGAPAVAAVGDTVLVSRATGVGGAQGDFSSSLDSDRSISADGRCVAFASFASNLDPDTVPGRDVFVRDLVANTTTLVSRSSGANGAAGDDDSDQPSISADGRYVAFRSFADNLNADDNDAVTNVFVRDLVANTTTLVSRASGASGVAGDRKSDQPSISGDGRSVAFRSAASTLNPDSDGDDVFVRNLVANTTTVVSRASGATGAAGDDFSEDPSVSADGRFVAFESVARNLAPDDGDFVADVFVRDLVANTTTLVSRASGASGAVGDDSSDNASISADGRFVAFESSATNLDPDKGGAVLDLFVRDLVANTTTLISRASGVTGAAGDDNSFNPSISADGRFVAFQSSATNLDADSTDTVADVFVRDLIATTTTLVSRASGVAGAVGNGNSVDASISADGRFVVFESRASNLDPGSDDEVSDVFRRQVLPDPAPPTPPGPPATGGSTNTCAGLAATIPGTPGDDVLVGTKGRDVIVGGDGDDRIRGLGGNDVICGGDGRDRINGGDGRDRINGGDGADDIDGQDGRDKISGGDGRDELDGGSGDDRLAGNDGDDELEGKGGDDRLLGGSGDDKLFGGEGRDHLTGGKGNDRLRGGPGHDRT